MENQTYKKLPFTTLKSRLDPSLYKLLEYNSENLSLKASEIETIDKCYSQLFIYCKDKLPEPITLANKIIWYDKKDTAIKVLSGVLQRYGAYLSSDFSQVYDYYLINDYFEPKKQIKDKETAKLIRNENRTLLEANDILLSDLLSQLLHSEPIPEAEAFEAYKAAEKRHPSDRYETLEYYKKEYAICSLRKKRIQRQLHALANNPDAMSLVVYLPLTNKEYTLSEAFDIGEHIVIHDHLFDTTTYDKTETFCSEDDTKEFMSFVRKKFPEWSLSFEEIDPETLLEHFGGITIPRKYDLKDEELAYADYNIQLENGSETDHWYSLFGEDYGIPAVGMFPLLRAICKAPYVQSDKRMSYRAKVNRKKPYMEKLEQEIKDKQTELVDQITRELTELGKTQISPSGFDMVLSPDITNVIERHNLTREKYDAIVLKILGIYSYRYYESVGLAGPQYKKLYNELLESLHDDYMEMNIELLKQNLKQATSKKTIREIKHLCLNFEYHLTYVFDYSDWPKDDERWKGINRTENRVYGEAIERKGIECAIPGWGDLNSYILRKYNMPIEDYLLSQDLIIQEEKKEETFDEGVEDLELYFSSDDIDLL